MSASLARLIMCQPNRKRQLKAAFAEQMVCAPYKLSEALGYLTRHRILLRSLLEAAGKSGVADLDEIVERNLLRRKTRLPRLYANAISAAVYRSITRVKLRLLHAVIRKHFDDNPQADGLVFNGYLAPSALVEAEALSRGRKVLYLEKGYFPNTIQCDCGGINADAHLPRSADFYRALGDRIPQELPQVLERRVNKKAGAAIADLPDTFVFVPFQVPSDMQILKHSPWVRNMPDFYEVLLQLTERCNFTFVVKEHPSFPISIKNKVRSHPRIIFANNNDTADLIARCKAVLTINSTVGLEALSRDRPVISIGKAIYNIPEIVRHARSRCKQ